MTKCTVITSIYKAERFLPVFLRELLSFQEMEDVEYLLLHVQPDEKEKAIVSTMLDDRYKKTRYIEITEHEGLYATWNRGVSLANGEYIAIWNVDDIRTIEGFKDQIKILDENPKAALVYGNFYHTRIHAKDTTMLYTVISEKQDRRVFMEECHLTCFPMWRKSVHDVIGYFDEQFKVVGDYDFQIRLAQKFNLKKVTENLGWYYMGDIGKLSSNWEQMMIEHTTIGLRYKNYKIIHPFLLRSAKLKYVYNAFVFNKKAVPRAEFNSRYYHIQSINKSYFHLVKTLFKDSYIYVKKKGLKPVIYFIKAKLS